MRPLVIYHGNCADGFGAAWCVRHALGECDFFPGIYQNDPPDVTGRDVIMVDFSYKRAVLLSMLGICRSMLLIDHHKTALAEIEGLSEDTQEASELHGKLQVIFDMERSGAGLAWDHFHPNALGRIDLINHIEDRDLWRFKLPRTREIQAAVFSYPYDFEVWDQLMKMNIASLASEGVAIERKHHKDIAELIVVTRREMVIGDIKMPVANLPYTLTSDAGHKMATEAEGVAACYWDTSEGRVFSLRSTDAGPDVSEIAKAYGGGGHAHAAGFRMPIGWEGDQ